MDGLRTPATAPRIWQVGALCRAIADALEARFNPVAVRGEISGFSRAASGHCYFTLKDANGQIRCAMFRRAASLLDFSPRDGELVEVRGKLGVYEPRGDLQLIVESMSRAGQGALFEQFLRLKAKLEEEGLFDPDAKRPLLPAPRGIGVVTSLGAAALHDVLTALRRRVPHIPVVVAPAPVQGTGAPPALIEALRSLYRMATVPGEGPPIDVILLVRGGGSMEDLWAFNDEFLARAIRLSPVPLVSGVGHETDFTIADFTADLRAPTPTAAAELCAQPREAWELLMQGQLRRLQHAAGRQLDQHSQRLDRAAARLGRPSGLANRQHLQLSQFEQRLRHAVKSGARDASAGLQRLGERLPASLGSAIASRRDPLERASLRLSLLDPRLVLKRGYALLTDAQGRPVTSVSQTKEGDALRGALSDGEVDLRVTQKRAISP